MKKKIVFGIICTILFAVFAALPLFQSGFIPTHDGEYHIVRFMDFFRMLSQGYWIPRWAPTLNSGYGVPIFLFHYPLPNYIGSLFMAMGGDAVQAFKVSMAVGYIVAGIFCFLWLNRLFGAKAALTGAIVALYVPYWFVDIYVRGSIGEIWALAFLFCSLYSSESRSYTGTSLSVAGLTLSHNILAMAFLPFIILYVLLRNRTMAYGIITGIALSAYFWLPALMEQRYVIGLNTVRFDEHFARLYELIIPSWGTDLSGGGFAGNKMSFQIGFIPIILIGTAGVLGFSERRNDVKRMVFILMVIITTTLLLTLSFSLPIWKNIVLLQYMQYPWRLLSFVIPIAGFAGAYISNRIRFRGISVLLVVSAIIFSYSYTRPVVYEPRDSVYYESRRNFTDGTSSMGNSFSTIWSGWKDKRSEYIIDIRNGKMVNGFGQNKYLNKSFDVASEAGGSVSLPILYFPGWQAYIDGKKSIIAIDQKGTITFDIPSGKHKARVVFTDTPVRILSNAVSMFALVWLIGWGILRVYARRNPRFSTHRSPQQAGHGYLRKKSH